jgi:hypothetical protein
MENQRNQQNFMPKTAKQIPAGAVKSRAAREFLGGISAPTLGRLVRRGLIRPNRSTRHLLFDINELQRFLRDGMA